VAVINGVDADIAGLDCFGDCLDQGTIPRGDGQDAGFGNSHGCNLLDRRRAAVIIHHYFIQDAGVCAACTDRGQLAVKMGNAVVHFFFVNFGRAAHEGFLLFRYIN